MKEWVCWILKGRHLIQTKLVRATVGRTTVDNNSLRLTLLDAIPEVVQAVAIAKHGIGGENVELSHCRVSI